MMSTSANLREEMSDRIINQCYMTGQQCVYYRNLLSRPSSGAFVLSPFTSDYDHMYDHFWSVLDLTEIGIEGKVRRADTVPRTGYVMCSRICYPIQQSALVIADVTAGNLNVFYELGIACALKKKLILQAHNILTPDHIRKFLDKSGLHEHTHYYSKDKNPVDLSVLADAQPSTLFSNSTNSPNIENSRVLVFSNDHEEYLKLGEPHRSRESMMCEIIRAVLCNLSSPTALGEIAERVKVKLSESGDEARGIMVTEDEIVERFKSLAEGLYGFHQATLSQNAANSISSADLIILDTSLEDFETFFWFGACHGLQKEVVPLSATDQRVTEIDHPFDIRTLWHVYGALDIKSIRGQLSQILSELIAGEVSSKLIQNRTKFWCPIIKSPKVSFYMGTEQARHLESRQVMGEWDVRTFQELSSFATLRSPTLDTIVVKPAFRRKSYTSDQIKSYKELLTQRVGGSHCVVVGTPDVNPVAEMALCTLKGVEPFKFNFKDESKQRQEKRPDRPTRFPVEGYVPFKNHLYDKYPPNPTSFFVQFDSDVPFRGFLYFGRDGKYVGECAAPYIPRDRTSSDGPEKFKKWDLISHLVVAPNPFSESYPETPYRIALVMGIGGPATFALAHLLTGRPPESYLRPLTSETISNFIETSEKILSSINSLISTKGAAEALVQVSVLNNIASTDNKYEDSRECIGISLAEPNGNIENPKPFIYKKSI